MSHTKGDTTISGGTIVTPTTEISDGTVVISDGKITALEDRLRDSPDVDATDKYILPGFVDLHGDDIERHLFPRDGEQVDASVALDRCDVANVSAGVTTKYHAIAFEDAPDDNRSIAVARELADHVRKFDCQSGARADNRLHLRCELTNDHAVDMVSSEIQSGGDLVSLVSHIPGEGQFADDSTFEQRYGTTGKAGETSMQGLKVRRCAASSEEIVERARTITDHARDANIPVASHDDADVSSVDTAAAMGVDISEYPLSIDAARRASELGMTVVMGAPNVVRGGSMWDGPDAREAIRKGVVDVLCSDFRPQSLLGAVFEDSRDSLPAAVHRVATAPAAVAGLYDRGRLEQGARADIAIVDPEPTPSVSRTYVAGDEVYRSV